MRVIGMRSTMAYPTLLALGTLDAAGYSAIAPVLGYAVGALVAWLLVSRRVAIRARAILARRCPPQPLVTIATPLRRSSGVPNIRLAFVAG
jgi:hypothetical protein